jgi:hypothetical protein
MKFLKDVRQNLASGVSVALCATMLALVTTGCTPQQQANTKAAIARIDQYEPELVVAVDTVSSTVAVFLPQDAALITSVQAQFDATAAELKTLCDAYVATPNAGTLASIQSALTTLLNTNADQFLAAAHISDPVSVASAKLAIGAVRTILLLMQGQLQTVQTPAQNAAAAKATTLKISQVLPYLDKHRVEQATGVPFRVAVVYEESQGF